MVTGSEERRGETKRPWWFQPSLRSPTSALLLGAGWLIVAVINLILLVAEGKRVRWLFGFLIVLALVLASAVIASGLILRREGARDPRDHSP